MKKTRFVAACNGFVEKEKAEIRRQLVDNALKSNQLDLESKLIEIDEQKNQVIRDLATADNSLVKNNIQRLADLLQKEETLNAAMNLSKKVLTVLDEEIEVEEEKEK